MPRLPSMELSKAVSSPQTKAPAPKRRWARKEATVFAGAGIDLIGSESQSVGPENAPMAVHLTLLSAEIVLLEGIRLSAVPDGAYMLNCAPLNLGEADGAPCRAILCNL